MIDFRGFFALVVRVVDLETLASLAYFMEAIKLSGSAQVPARA